MLSTFSPSFAVICSYSIPELTSLPNGAFSSPNTGLFSSCILTMVSDFVSNVSLPCLSKKKRTNRLAKLKQCKLDVRREQWLSQVRNKESKVDLNGRDESSPFSTKRADEQNKSLHHLETKSRREDNEDMSIHDSDLESLMNSPIPSDVGHNDSREAGSSCSGSSTGSSTSCGFCSGSVSEEEEDGCVDNWEDFADALSADDNQHNPAMVAHSKYETRIESACADQQYKNQRIDQLNDSEGTICGSHMNCRAWRPDDAFRPRSLPSLSKQLNISLNSAWHDGHAALNWAPQSTISHPSSCPICCEDLDVTDSSFLPCPCGFRLCLFCHKRILEADGRCPGCRKHYDTINGDVCFSR